MQDAQQDELVSIVRHGDGCTVDAERKNNLDKYSEGRRVTSVARASRNGLLRRYLHSREGCEDRRLHASRCIRKSSKLNVRALAIERKLELFARGRGALKWERNISLNEREQKTSRGDEGALKAYIVENREYLENALRRCRAKAQAQAELEKSLMPMTHSDWMAWWLSPDDLDARI